MVNSFSLKPTELFSEKKRDSMMLQIGKFLQPVGRHWGCLI
jgi:hypothetical protein